MDLVPNDRQAEVSAPFICVVAGGNHVMNVVDAADTDGAFDVIEVLAQPGGGPPPHCHAFAEWFHVIEGELTFTGARDGQIVPVATAGPGEVVMIPPGAWHGTRNDGITPVRFSVIGRPGVMTSYFRQAGVPVASMTAAPDREPPGPAELARIAEAHEIVFWPQASSA